MVGGADDDQKAGQDGEDGQGVVYRWPDERQHGSQEDGEDNPVQSDPEFTRVFGQRDAQEADDPVNRQIGYRPRGDDPEWGAFQCVVSPQVGMDIIHTFSTG